MNHLSQIICAALCAARRYYYCVVICVMAAAQAHAQYNETQLLSNIKGLNDNEVSNVFIDSKNGVWISNFSATGINLYNGQKVNHIKTLQGKPSSGHNNALEDRYGNIWVAREDVGITQYYNGKITDYEVGKNDMPIISGATLDWNTHTLLAYNNTGEVYYFDYKTQKFVPKFKVPFVNKPYELYKVMANIDGTYFFQAYNSDAGTSDIILYDKGNFTLLPRITPKNNIRPARIVGGKHLVCAIDGKFFVLLPDHSDWREIPTPAPVVQNQKDFWNIVGGRQDQFFIIRQPKPDTHEVYELSKNADEWVKKAVFKSKFMLFALANDLQGNFWFSSSGGALKVYKNFVNYTLDDHSQLADLATLCQTTDGILWAASASKGLAYWQPQTEKFVETLPALKGSMGALALPNNQMLLPIERGANIITNGVKSQNIFMESAVNRWKFINNKIVCLTPNDGILISKNENTFVNNIDGWVAINENTVKGMDFSGAVDAAADRHGNLWFGKITKGVAVYLPKKNVVKTWHRTAEATDFGVGALTTDPQGNVWLGTNKGIYFYDTKHFDENTTKIFADAQPIAPQLLGDYKVASLLIYKNKYLIAGTAGGVAVIDIEAFYKNKQAQPPIIFYNKNNGFSAEMCINHGIIIDQKQPNAVYVAHEQGITKMVLGTPKIMAIPAHLRIDSIQAGISNPKIQGNYIFIDNPRVSSFKIFFSDTTNRYNSGETAYQYRIVNKNEVTNYSDFFYDTHIDLPYITPGKYTLEIVAVQNGIATKPYVATIEIKDFWFKQLWFWLMAGTVIGFVIYRTQHHQAQIKAQQLRNDQLQSQTIATQLNPHFLNNALQLLQSRITNDPEAVRFVGKLSENVQMVFMNTRKKLIYHRLSDEMTLLENYLIMQKFRFGKRLEYTLPPKAETERLGSYLVLLMQLQIHCENAIEHGIRNQEHGGELNINFVENNDYICIEIQDTGIGRKNAAKIGSKSTQQGTLMLSQLHSIYNASIRNKKNEKIVSYYTDDIYHTPEYKPYGTKVTIKIPKIYSYELD